MNRFTKWIKKNILRLPVLDHDAAQIAAEREKIASSISEEQIFIETVRRAISVDGATISDKLMFAFTSLPGSTEKFDAAKDMFFQILESLQEANEVSESEINEFRKCLKNITSVEEIMTLDVEE